MYLIKFIPQSVVNVLGKIGSKLDGTFIVQPLVFPYVKTKLSVSNSFYIVIHLL